MQFNFSPISRSVFALRQHQDPARLAEEALAARVAAYWAARGKSIAIKIENHGFSDRMRANLFTMRSDMVNGMPRHD